MTARAVSTAPRPDEIVALHELRDAIDRALRSLTAREALIVRRYYGLEGEGCSYDTLGLQLGISGSRVYEIAAKALRKLRRRRILHSHVVARTRSEVETRRIEAIQDAEERRLRDELHYRVG